MENTEASIQRIPPFFKASCACSFTIETSDIEYGMDTFLKHPCPHRPPPMPIKWHESLFDNLFSVSGMVFAVVIFYIVYTLNK